MAKKKDSKALFEVLSKSETTMSVPDWMKAKPAVSDASLPAEDSVSPPVPMKKSAPTQNEQEQVAAPEAKPAKVDVPKAETPKAAPAKVEEAKVEPAVVEKTKAEITKEILAKAKKAKADKAKAELVAKAEKAKAEKAAAEKAKAEKTEKAKAEKTRAKTKKQLDDEVEEPEEDEETTEEELQDEASEEEVEDVEEDDEVEDVEDEADEEDLDEEEDVEDVDEVDDVVEEDLEESDEEAEIAPRKRRSLSQPKWFHKPGQDRPPVKTSDGEAVSARISLNPKMIAILVVAAALLLVLAFILGQLTQGQSGTSSENQAAAPVDGKELRPVVGDDAPVTCQSGRRDPDRFFLIIETLRGNGDADKTEAERIIKFCKAQGMPADMVEMQMGDKNRVAVWSLQGFRFQNSEEALEFARKVEDTGSAYFKKHKTYKFLQRRKRDGSLRPFFLSGKIETGG